MSGDKGKGVMSNSIENGASHFMFKPICADDLRDIWQYTSAANIGSDLQIIENGEMIFLNDTNEFVGPSSPVTCEPKRAIENNKGKRRICETDHKEDDQSDEGNSSKGKRKSKKMTWSTTLHNRFLAAIKHIGLEKSVPKRILEVMNVPGLTRENVASHLQKYRQFLKNIADKGIIDESISDRTLRSRFASELPVSMIKDIQSMAQKLSPQVQQYLKGQGGPTFQGLFGKQQQQLLQRGNELQNQQENNSALRQVRLGNETINFGSRILGGTNHNINIHRQNMLLGSFNEGSNTNAAGPVFPAYGIGHHGLLTSANGLISGGLKFGGTMPQQNSNPSLERNNSLNYGLGNKTNLPPSSASYYPTSVSSGSQMINSVGAPANNNITNYNYNYNYNYDNNSFGKMNGAQTEINMNVTPPLWNNGDSGLVQGSYSASSNPAAAAARTNVYAGNELMEVLVSANANRGGGNNASAGIMQQLPQQVDAIWNGNGNGNAAGINNENQTYGSSIRVGEAAQVETDDLSNIFKMLNDIELPNETGENKDANGFLNFDISDCFVDMQPPDQQLEKAGDVIVPSTEMNINLPNESPTSTGKNALQGNDGFIDWESFDSLFVGNNVSSASNSVVTQNQDWDMDFFQPGFGNEAN